MRVIIADKNTPDDLKELFKVVEPEESYHAMILRKIATKHGMDSVRDCHDKGLEELGLKIKYNKDFESLAVSLVKVSLTSTGK